MCDVNPYSDPFYIMTQRQYAANKLAYFGVKSSSASTVLIPILNIEVPTSIVLLVVALAALSLLQPAQ
jgi:hypothetical protein